MSKTRLAVPVSASDHIQGDLSAPFTLVEYGDYECSYCGQAYPLIQAAQSRLGARLCFVFRNFPVSQMHPHAAQAALAAEVADAQGHFWPMHDLLYEHQDQLEDTDLMVGAAKLGLDTIRFSTDLKAGKFNARVQADFESGIESGVNGTPTFFINGIRFDGNWQYNGLLQALRNA